jgi:hypothetical protein
MDLLASAAAATRMLDTRSVEEEEEDAFVDSCCQWFAQFYMTHFMFNRQHTHAIALPFDEKKYEEYCKFEQLRHTKWQEWCHVRSTNTTLPEEPEPPAIISRVAWSFKEGLLSNEQESIYPWSLPTLAIVVLCYCKDDGISPLVDIVSKRLDAEAEVLDMDIKNHPIGMFLSGVLLRSNWKWISRGDLEKLATAHGCTDAEADTNKMLQAIYRSQIRMCREIIDARLEEPSEYCVVRGVLEDNKKALNLRVLREERPTYFDRVRLIPHSKKGLEGMDCKQCGYRFWAEDAAVRDEYPEHLLDAICTACSELPCQ